MKYRVYNIKTHSFVNDDSDFIIKPDGTLAVNRYGDEIAQPDCTAIFFPTEDKHFYFDSIGGIHDSGTAYAPNGDFCGECSNVSCEICPVWLRIKK